MKRMGFLIKVALFACSIGVLLFLTACDENVVKAPPPAEKDPQFVIERTMLEAGSRTMYVVRDKVNGKLIYITPGAGIAVVEDHD